MLKPEGNMLLHFYMLRCSALVLLSLFRIEMENNCRSVSINFLMLYWNKTINFSLYLSNFPLCNPLLCGCIICCPDPAARHPFLFVSLLHPFPAACFNSYSLWHIFSLDVWHKLRTSPSRPSEIFIFAIFLVESMPNVFFFLLKFLPFVQPWDLVAFENIRQGELHSKWNSNNGVCL